MATLCIRSTDCLAGRASFGAHRGVRAAPALAPRLPMQQRSQHGSQTLATASPPHVALNSRSARGRANGQQRRRRSPPASGPGSPPHKGVMENIVILRRGQAVPEKAETDALAGKDADAGVAAAARRGEREKVDESVAAAKQSSEEAEKCEAVAAVDQRAAPEEAPETAVAADNMGTETKEAEEPVVATNQSGAETTMEENEPEATASQSGAQAETAEPVAAVDQRGPDTREKEEDAAEHRGADAMKSEPAPDPPAGEGGGGRAGVLGCVVRT
ncbi:uncharacterized protein [Miscanthus floridulus]|uniref:uncharacterized protein n=1 Tax=Miscanthus floridulus TaxID=154761 RepID=UPI003459B6FB